MANPEVQTLPALFEKSARKFSTNIMMWEKKGEKFKGTTYAEIRDAVYHCAAGLMMLGIQRGDRIALLSEGRNEWVIAELGILYAGGINVPLSVKIDEPSELRFRLEHSGCSMAVVSENQARKIAPIRADLPLLSRLIILGGGDDQVEDRIPFDRLLACGREYLSSHRSEFEDRWRSLRGDDVANICYTSGTVADPKGIVLTHRNYTANIAQSVALYPLPEWYCTLLILPWDHAFGHTAGIYALSSCGGSCAAVQIGKTPMETLRNIPLNIKELRPTFLLSVPSLAKNFRKGIEAGVRQKGKAVQALFRAGLKIAQTYNADGWRRGRGWRQLLKPLNALFDKLVFRKVRENFGGRLDYFIGGGALLDAELQRFFYAIGIPMYQGYGLTEASPVISANTPGKHKIGTSGALVPDLEAKIYDGMGNALPQGIKGEIVVRGENVMAGYWKNEKATQETIRDGWLFTGDLGYFDEDGFLVVLGREKSLLIGHDGEKFSPEGIEETLVGNSPYIDQVMLYNNQSPYTVSLLVPNRERLVDWLKAHHLTSQSRDGQEAVLRLLEKEIDAYLPGGRHGGLFPERWIPSAFAVLGEPFTEQNRLLNSTLKMVRGRIEETHRKRIEALFTTEGKGPTNADNLKIIEGLGV